MLNKATDAVLPWLPEKALSRDEMMARPHKNISFTWDETYTLPENFYLGIIAGRAIGTGNWRKRFLQDDSYFGPLAENRNVLPGQHAYSHVNALSSAMQAYLTDGSEMHLRAARNGFRFVLEQSYATGGWGPQEGFTQARNRRACKLAALDPCELRNTVRRLRTLQDRPVPDPGNAARASHGDSMEAVLYNTILGARPIRRDGVSFYYSDYNMDGQKVGLRRQVAVLLWDLSAAHGGLRDQLVFPFAAGRVCESFCAVAGDLEAGQRAGFAYPADELSEFERNFAAIEAGPPERFVVALRVPHGQERRRWFA